MARKSHIANRKSEGTGPIRHFPVPRSVSSVTLSDSDRRLVSIWHSAACIEAEARKLRSQKPSPRREQQVDKLKARAAALAGEVKRHRDQ